MSNHDKFLDNLKASRVWVWKTAELLSECGYAVTLHPTTYAETQADWREHIDNGDLSINQTIEVKHRQIDFTSRNDFPFADMMVSAVDTHKRKNPRPWGYVHWNKQGTHIAVVKTDTESSWSIRPVRHGKYDNHVRDVFHCPLDLVTFHATDNNR